MNLHLFKYYTYLYRTLCNKFNYVQYCYDNYSTFLGYLCFTCVFPFYSRLLYTFTPQCLEMKFDNLSMLLIKSKSISVTINDDTPVTDDILISIKHVAAQEARGPLG